MFCVRRNPDFLRVFLIEHNFKHSHRIPAQPTVWYYIPIVLVAFCHGPLLTGIGLGLLVQGPSFSASTLFLLWALFCLLFFSLEIQASWLHSTAVPAIGLLLARATSSQLVTKLLSLASFNS